MNYVKEYYEQISTGKIIAGKKIIKEYKKLNEEMKNDSLPFYFDEEVGNRPIEFIEKFWILTAIKR